LKAMELIRAADEMDADEQAMRLEWIESAVPHARKEEDPAQRVRLLASLAERLFDLGEVARARQILTEAENDAKPLLLPDYGAQYAALRLALAAAAHGDADRALDRLAKSGIYLQWHGGRVATRLLPDHPRRAVEAWNLVAEAMRKNRGRTGHEYRVAAEFCYRLALVDRSLGEQVTADADEAILRYREKGALILALAETQPAEARRLLAALVREEIPQLTVDESWHPGLPMQSAPAIAAWLLPVAERVEPELCGELFWRSLALRLPRPDRNSLNDQAEFADIELAKLLARYDRDIARVLLEPSAANASALGPTQVQSATAGRILLAAVHVDPRWAKSFLESVAESSTGLPPRGMTSDDSLRFNLLYTLSLPLPDRWNGRNDSDSAAFWAPAAKHKPLPP
ncbi:MAG TPA: hypothetical protein VFW87_02920, partial [Pirellulales bacterium]|nr:hypothetical protein [Pirellulales bacterium]